MKTKFLMLIGATLTIVIFGNITGLAQRQSAPSLTNRQPLAETTATRGTPELRRERQSDYQPTTRGDELFTGDVVRVPKGSMLTIRCTSTSRNWTIPDDNLPRGVANLCARPQM
jgi:hypothetical protein